MDIPIFSIQNPILVNSPLLQFYEVPHADIWFSHFYLNVLQGTIAGFSGALPVLAREGVAKFWITLYTVYFEASLRELRPILDQAQVLPPTLPDEAIYGDDADFIDAEEGKRKEQLVKHMTPVLGEANLKVNETKTEHTTLERKKKGKCYKVRKKSDSAMKLTLTRESEMWRMVKNLAHYLV